MLKFTDLMIISMDYERLIKLGVKEVVQSKSALCDSVKDKHKGFIKLDVVLSIENLEVDINTDLLNTNNGGA